MWLLSGPLPLLPLLLPEVRAVSRRRERRRRKRGGANGRESRRGGRMRSMEIYDGSELELCRV